MFALYSRNNELNVLTMYKFSLLICALISSIANAQLTCNIAASNDTAVCGGASFGVSVTGEIHELRWEPALGLSADDIPNPIVNINNSITYLVTNKRVTDNIITNGDFSNGSTGFDNDYVIDCPNTPYGPDVGTWMEGAPNDGQYCVVPPTSFAFALGGWKACSDHSGNGGNLMYVNGDITNNARIWCQTVPVDQNTDYQFSTWITSVYKGNPAKLAFSINGGLLGSPFTAEENTCNWDEFFEIWDSGINTSAEICIVNQNTVSNGNDFALDDITFQKVCIDKDSIEITVNPQPPINLGNDRDICPGDSVDIGTGYPNTNGHAWNTGSTNNSIKVGGSGEYQVQVIDNNGCIGYDTIVFNEIDTPFAHLPMDTTICFFLTKSFELRSQDEARIYDWSTGETAQSILISQPGTYVVEVINTANCSSSDTIQIEEECEATFLYTPNTFTPNDDSKNDEYFVKGENVYAFKIEIYNRWGQFLFESEDINSGWDGTYLGNQVATGVYVYKLMYTGVSSKTNKAQDIVKYGHINLLR